MTFTGLVKNRKRLKEMQRQYGNCHSSHSWQSSFCDRMSNKCKCTRWNTQVWALAKGKTRHWRQATTKRKMMMTMMKKIGYLNKCAKACYCCIQQIFPRPLFLSPCFNSFLVHCEMSFIRWLWSFLLFSLSFWVFFLCTLWMLELSDMCKSPKQMHKLIFLGGSREKSYFIFPLLCHCNCFFFLQKAASQYIDYINQFEIRVICLFDNLTYTKQCVAFVFCLLAEIVLCWACKKYPGRIL